MVISTSISSIAAHPFTSTAAVTTTANTTSTTITAHHPRMSLKELKRTAVVAWSPPLHSTPLLATGTLAGALDASFSTQAELEIHDLMLDDKGAESIIRGTNSCPSRFNRLVWSAHGGAEGVLVGGCEDGTVSFWNVNELLKKSNNEESLIARCEAHQGAVRGLQVNPFQPFLVASGATDAQVWLWDLNNLQQPYSPSASKSSKLEDITDLAWNRIVPHILATSSNSGVTVVWDLKSRKEVLQLANPSQRLSMSALAWNPENATHILIASDDDSTPVIYSWDLRNARAPEKVLSGGHGKGILSLAWCPKDAELLLSGGKDCKALCWNPKSGSLIGELTHSENWIFDVQWCPRNPDLFSTASFSGKVQVNSFQGVMAAGGASGMSAATTKGGAEDFFSMTGIPPSSSGVIGSSMPMAASGAATSATMAGAAGHLVQIPKWLRRPIGISFGFGGRMVSFSSLRGDSSRVVIVTAVVIPPAASLVGESIKLDEALSQHLLTDYCREKIPHPVQSLQTRLGGEEGEAVFWNVAKVLFENNPPAKLASLLSSTTGPSLEEQIRKLGLAEKALEVEHEVSLVSPKPPTTTKDGTRRASFAASPTLDFFARTSKGQEHQEGQTGEINGRADSLGLDMGGEFDFGSLVGSGTNQFIEETVEGNKEADQPANIALQDDFKPKSGRRGTFGGVEFQLFGSESSDVDKVITRAIIQGDFKTAVDVCVRSERLSDALLVAICGGEELVAQTQKIYFQKSRVPYLRLVSGIVKGDLTDVVENAQVEDWEAILALICARASSSTTGLMSFTNLCGVLGERLAQRIERLPVGSDDNGMTMAALIINMAAGKVTRAVSLLLKHAQLHRPNPTHDLLAYAQWLETVVEKIRIIQQAAAYTSSPDAALQADHLADELPIVSKVFLHYSYVMAQGGLVGIAARYFNSIGGTVAGQWWQANESLRRFARRLAAISPSVSVPLSLKQFEAEGEEEKMIDVQPELRETAAPPMTMTTGAAAMGPPTGAMPMTGTTMPSGTAEQPPWSRHMQSSTTTGPGAGLGKMISSTTPSIPPPTLTPWASKPPSLVPPSSASPALATHVFNPYAAVPSSPSAPTPPSAPISSVPTSTLPSLPRPSPVGAGIVRPVSARAPTPSTVPSGSAFSYSGNLTPSNTPPSSYAVGGGPTQSIPLMASSGTGTGIRSPPPPPMSGPTSTIMSGPSAQSISSIGSSAAPSGIATATVPSIPLPRPIMPSSGAFSTTQPGALSSTSRPTPTMGSGPSPTMPGDGGAPSQTLTPNTFMMGPRRATGAYNDPPMVAPRVPPPAPITTTATPNMMMTSGSVGGGSTDEMTAATRMTMPGHATTTASSGGSSMMPMPGRPVGPTTAAPNGPTSSSSQTSPGGPVDPASIPSNLQPIYQTFSTLISQCQERALPMQRRVVEDSARKMQILFQQLALPTKLSPPVIQTLLEMCTYIGQGQYEKAHELHHPLMTGYFAEAGAWILAAKRLIEVAKICLR